MHCCVHWLLSCCFIVLDTLPLPFHLPKKCIVHLSLLFCMLKLPMSCMLLVLTLVNTFLLHGMPAVPWHPVVPFFLHSTFLLHSASVQLLLVLFRRHMFALACTNPPPNRVCLSAAGKSHKTASIRVLSCSQIAHHSQHPSDLVLTFVVGVVFHLLISSVDCAKTLVNHRALFFKGFFHSQQHAFGLSHSPFPSPSVLFNLFNCCIQETAWAAFCKHGQPLVCTHQTLCCLFIFALAACNQKPKHWASGFCFAQEWDRCQPLVRVGNAMPCHPTVLKIWTVAKVLLWSSSSSLPSSFLTSSSSCPSFFVVGCCWCSCSFSSCSACSLLLPHQLQLLLIIFLPSCSCFFAWFWFADITVLGVIDLFSCFLPSLFVHLAGIVVVFILLLVQVCCYSHDSFCSCWCSSTSFLLSLFVILLGCWCCSFLLVCSCWQCCSCDSSFFFFFLLWLVAWFCWFAAPSQWLLWHSSTASLSFLVTTIVVLAILLLSLLFLACSSGAFCCCCFSFSSSSFGFLLQLLQLLAC